MTKKRMKAADRRDYIIKAAAKLFAAKGFHGVSVDDIAKQSKVSPAVLYKHFNSKATLYTAVLEEMSGHRDNYIDIVLYGQDDFISVLERMTLMFAENVCNNPDFLRMEMQVLLSIENEKTKKSKRKKDKDIEIAQRFFDSRWKCFTDIIGLNIDELQEKNKIGKVDKVTAGLMYQGMVREALLAKCIYASPRLEDISLPDLVKELLYMFFTAIGYKEYKKSRAA